MSAKHEKIERRFESAWRAMLVDAYEGGWDECAYALCNELVDQLNRVDADEFIEWVRSELVERLRNENS